MGSDDRQYSAADLYGADSRPRASDIRQDDIFNCYFLAPVGSLGEQQPDRIRDAIRFNPETDDFTVRLYRPPNADERSQGQTGPIEESVTVSQDDLRRNIEREKGGSTADNRRDRSGALWPAVLEAGFAELYGRDSEGRVNLNRGYELIGDRTRGGSLGDGMYALTGDSGDRVRIIAPAGGPPMVRTGNDHIDRGPPPFSALASPASRLSLDDAGTRIEQALAEGRPVSMSTQGRDVRDGLMESHAYMVMGIARDAESGDTLVRLRNPYGTNRQIGEGNQNVGPGWNDANPEITVRLNPMVAQGSFGEFNIGPAPRTQAQDQSQAPPVAPAIAPPSSTVDPQGMRQEPPPPSGAPPDNAEGAHAAVPLAFDRLPQRDRDNYEQAHSLTHRLGLPQEEAQNFSMAMAAEIRDNPLMLRTDRIIAVQGRGDDGGDRVFASYHPHGDKEPIFNVSLDVNPAVKVPMEQSLNRIEQSQQQQFAQAPSQTIDDPSRGPKMG